MSDPIEEAVRRLRGLKERVDRLEGQREGEGEINLFRIVEDRTNISDTINARLNDIEIFDRSNTDDTVATTTGNPADFVWIEHILGFESTLTVGAGTTTTISAGTTDTYSNADVDGILDVNGTLVLDAEKADKSGDKWDFVEWNTH